MQKGIKSYILYQKITIYWVGSQLSSKINGKSLIYKENSVGFKIHPCFTPTLEWKKSVISFPNFTENKKNLCIHIFHNIEIRSWSETRVYFETYTIFFIY
jgi:hypothetical protein